MSEIIDTFYPVRLELYQKRKRHQLEKITHEWKVLSNKVKFITAVIEGKLRISNRVESELLRDMAASYDAITNSHNKDKYTRVDGDQTQHAVDGETETLGGYAYLLSMPVHSLTYEKVQRLNRDLETKVIISFPLSRAYHPKHQQY